MTSNKDKHGDASSVSDVQSTPADAEIAGLAAAQKADAAALREGSAAVDELRAGSRGWFDWAQNAAKANFRAWQALLSCRSFPGAVAIYGRLAQEQGKLLLDGGRATMTAMIHTARVP
jgi:hypothetical protein